MKQFVCFALEGLRGEGTDLVWVTIGRYSTRDQTLSAAANLRDTALVETRVIPCYRVSLASQRTNSTPITSPGIAG